MRIDIDEWSEHHGYPINAPMRPESEEHVFRKRDYTKDEDALIKKLRSDGVKVRDIAERIGRSFTSVQSRIIKLRRKGEI